MKFEIEEYTLDENGKPKVSHRYEIEQFELSRTIDSLNELVRDGVIYDFDVCKV